MGSFVGFRFHPTPQELIGHYLRKKRLDPAFSVHKIRDADIYGYEPSELPKIFPVHPDEQEWHFFCKPDYKYTNSNRVNRRTMGGNWKVTGKKRDVKDKRKKVIGWKITLVFYEGSGNSKGARTNWVMHEYHMENDPLFKKEFVVIRIKRNIDIKHDNSSSTNEDIPSHNVISSSGNHYSENIDLQVESDFGQTHPHNVNGSKLITGARVCDSYGAAEAESTIPAELSEFPSTANGVYDFPSMANGEYFNWIWPSESYPALDDIILPLQMGNVV